VSTSMEKQLANAGKLIGGAIDQLELDKRLSSVERKLGGVADKVGMADQRTLLGIPLSRKKPDWGRIAAVGAATVGAVAAGVRLFSGNGEHAESSEDDGSSAEAGDATHTAKDHKTGREEQDV
jgi:hypothetical protein